MKKLKDWTNQDKMYGIFLVVITAIYTIVYVVIPFREDIKDWIVQKKENIKRRGFIQKKETE